MKRHERPGMNGLRHFEAADWAPGMYTLTADERCDIIDGLGAPALREVLTLPDSELQRSVRQRAERRLRRLEKAEGKP